MKYRALVLAGMVAVGVLSGHTIALTQGTTGTSSEGSLSIQLSIPPLVRIQGLQDIDLGSYPGTGNLLGFSDACVQRNGKGTYSVSASSLNMFTLVGGVSLAYGLTWGGQPLGLGVVLGGQVPDATALRGICGNSASNRVGVKMLATDLQAAPPGMYTDVLTLMVQPD